MKSMYFTILFGVVALQSTTGAWDRSLKNLFGFNDYGICKVSLKSDKGKYVAGLGYHDRYQANANSDAIGPNEIWEVLIKGNDQVSLKSAHGRYLIAYGNGKVEAGAKKPNPWETFILEDIGNGTIAFKSLGQKGRYLVAGSDGSITNQDATATGTNATFEIIPAEKSYKHLFGCGGDEICQVSMKSEEGKYVSGLGYHDRYAANANKDTIGSDEIWEVLFKGDNMVSLKSAHGRYLIAYGNGKVEAGAKKPNPWETFIVEDMGNGMIAFKSIAHGKGRYLVAGSDGSLTNEDATSAAGFKFEIVPAKQSLGALFGCIDQESFKVSIMSEKGKYVSGLGYHERYAANANVQKIGENEIWEVLFKEDNQVSLKSAHGRYLIAYGNGKVEAGAQKPNPWETFTVEDVGNGMVAFKSFAHGSGRYLVAGSDGSLTNQDAAGASGFKFRIVPAGN